MTPKLRAIVNAAIERHKRGEVGDNEPMTVSAAAAVAYPDGRVTPSLLLGEIKKRRITCERAGGKIFLTLNYIKEWAARQQAFMSTPGTVYVIGFERFLKIGFTTGRAKHRIKTLSTACPVELQIFAEFPGTRLDERGLHLKFKEFRLRGEWFRNEGTLAEWIANRGWESGDV